MHDQKREEYKARLSNAVIASKLSQKAMQWNTLTSELLKIRNDIISKKDELNLENPLQTIENLLVINPDPSYLWNYRRELLEIKIAKGTQCNMEEWIHQEQLMTQRALECNPKAYGAWFHRKWCIRRFVQNISEEEKAFSSKCEMILNGELHLCAEFLKLDERNFHCWNYRRYIMGCIMDITTIFDEPNKEDVIKSCMNGAWKFTEFVSGSKSTPLIGAQMTTIKFIEPQLKKGLSTSSAKQKFYKIIQSEFKFTLDKILENFSNGSAFHYRSKLLPIIFLLGSNAEKGLDSLFHFKLVREELEIIRNAIFTEPDDQTCWWYLKFILDWANPEIHFQDVSTESVEEYKEILFDEWTSIGELVEAEEGHCKWGLLAMHMISSILAGSNFQGIEWEQKAISCVAALKLLDLDRLNRYKTLIEDDDDSK